MEKFTVTHDGPITVDFIVNHFGGTAATAKQFGVYASTVSGWKRRGYIPAVLHYRVYIAAQETGLDIPDSVFTEMARRADA